VEKKQNPNFIYIYSETLKQIVAMSKKDGRVVCTDGVVYTAAEIAVLVAAGKDLTLEEHNVKKAIGGEIVNCTKEGDQEKKQKKNKAEELDIF
jgi:hypothetical protein